jgi:hypothetical protein
MAKAVTLGDIVNYQPPVDQGPEAHAALVIAVRDDDRADLRIFNGYCLGSTDAQNVAQSDEADPGKYFYPPGPAPGKSSPKAVREHEHAGKEHPHNG